MSPDLQPCPCGRLGAHKKPLPCAACCGRYLDHFETVPAPDAEALMRSRYTAFVRERADYLLATWHPSRRPATLEFEAGAKWLGLEVKWHRQLDDAHAQVEFAARCRGADGRATRLQEISRFVREGGRWFYLDQRD